MSEHEREASEGSGGKRRWTRLLGPARDLSVLGVNLVGLISWLFGLLALGGVGLVAGIQIGGSGETPSPGVGVVAPGEPDSDGCDIDNTASSISNVTNVCTIYSEPSDAEPPVDGGTGEAGDDPKPDKEDLRELLAEIIAEEVANGDTDEPTTTAATPPVTVETVPASRRVIYNDDPALFDLDADTQDGEYSWFEPPAEINEQGWGDNGFRFTIAIGNSSDDALDNFARWEFDSVDGEFDIQAWIPAAWASAEIQYLIWVDSNGDGRFTEQENIASPWLDQSRASGWASLDTLSLDGRVRIEVQDTRSRDDWRVHGDEVTGVVASRIAVDAIRLVEVADRP